MKYEEIWLTTSDGLKLQGWFIFQASQVKNRDTIVFCHENAGNIALRMDFFEFLYKNLNVNIVTVAYRGYSAS
jgi:hypothetical protein